MPTNLPPDYYEIEKRFRVAESAAEKISLLEEMYSVVPKHKGTDHLRADLRRQISKCKEEMQQARKKHGGHGSAFQIDREGAGQVVLIGGPNTGKSSLVQALTNADPEISEAPYTTWKPTPGMMEFENVQVQLIDTPPLDPNFVDAGLFDLCRRAELLILVIDLSEDPFEQYETGLALLKKHRICPVAFQALPNLDPRTVFKPLMILVNKVDTPQVDEDFQVFLELFGPQIPTLPISVKEGRFFDEFKREVYKSLGIIRVYAKPPGSEADLERPFVMKAGSTVSDMAQKIHKDFFENLKSARIWGSSAFEGQMVQRDYILQEGDVVELKTT